MHPKSPKLLEDIRVAAEYILDATREQTADAYQRNSTLRFAVERNFEIIGEAMNRLRKIDQATADRIPNSAQIIAFRNLLIHGYDLVDYGRGWTVVANDLPSLRESIIVLLNEADADSQ